MTAVIDLRQYTLVPGRRDALIELFDRYLVGGQQAAGIHVIGQFRDLDDPDRFVWLRGWDSMASRGATLRAFYDGPVWHAHRGQANATMRDSANALLLEPLHLGAGFPRDPTARVAGPSASLVQITIAYLAGPVTAADRDLAGSAGQALAAAGAELVGVFTTHLATNNFPVLPLRDEHVLMWITRFPTDTAYARHRDLLAESPAWTKAANRLAARRSQLPMQQLRLRPTDRSQLR